MRFSKSFYRMDKAFKENAWGDAVFLSGRGGACGSPVEAKLMGIHRLASCGEAVVPVCRNSLGEGLLPAWGGHLKSWFNSLASGGEAGGMTVGWTAFEVRGTADAQWSAFHVRVTHDAHGELA
jgi:hypothetical protein